VIGIPQPSAKDLRFTIFGIRVRVNILFWVIALLFAWDIGRGDQRGLLVGLFVVFISILGHELGHALVSKKYGGCPREIVLHIMGGHAISERQLPRNKRLLGIAAGPGFNLALALIAFLIYPYVQGTNLAKISQFTFWVNLVWGVFNLAPVLPLDGGMLVETFLEGQVSNPSYRALRVSVYAGIVCAILALWAGFVFGTMIYGMMAYMAHQQTRLPPRPAWR